MTNNPYGDGQNRAAWVSASADGHVIGVNGGTGCRGGSTCSFRQLEWGVAIQTASLEALDRGPTAVVSRNGRFMASKSPSDGLPGGRRIEMKVLDLLTGEIRLWGTAGVAAVSSSGDAVKMGYFAAYRIRPMSS